MNYQTKTKQIIDDFLYTHAHEFFSCQQICEALADDGYKVGIASVHRRLNDLEELGLVRTDTRERTKYYQYAAPDCHSHFHFQCDHCHQIIHLECPELLAIARHLAMDHGFIINNEATIAGICRHCRRRKGC
ncbi:transcriptional repressor [bacterium]|nr:transcriptional repressor [bacterium]